MTPNEERIYGLKVWIDKGIKYLNGMSFKDFLKDEKTLDALCFCILMISEIASELGESDIIRKRFPGIDFDELAKTYSYTIKNDNINLNYVYDLFIEGFPLLIKEIK